MNTSAPGMRPLGWARTHPSVPGGWDLQPAVNVLMVAHSFNIRVSPQNFKLRFAPLPPMKPNRKLKFRIGEHRRELHA